MKKTINIFLILVLALFSNACTKNKDSADGTIIKKKKRDPNLKKRADEYKGAIIGGKDGVLFGGGQSTAQFAADNMLWRASLQSLQDVPIASANYSGGILISDWVDSNGTGTSYKIQVNFKSNELAVTSLDVKTFLKKCTANYSSCKLSNGSAKTNSEIKNKILNIARSLKIEDEKKKKNKK